ncbi:MAG: hypothetical protein IRY86_02075 [Thermorudis peleae]|nr:hypothetical protein [Thermorudis peleae]
MTAETRTGQAQLQALRARLLPILRALVAQFRDRAFYPGYPVIFDDIEGSGAIGLELAPGHSLTVLQEGDHLVVEIIRPDWRDREVGRSAGHERFGATPRVIRRSLAPNLSDAELRDELARLIGAWHAQPLFIYQSDT